MIHSLLSPRTLLLAAVSVCLAQASQCILKSQGAAATPNCTGADGPPVSPPCHACDKQRALNKKRKKRKQAKCVNKPPTPKCKGPKRKRGTVVCEACDEVRTQDAIAKRVQEKNTSVGRKKSRLASGPVLNHSLQAQLKAAKEADNFPLCLKLKEKIDALVCRESLKAGIEIAKADNDFSTCHKLQEQLRTIVGSKSKPINRKQRQTSKVVLKLKPGWVAAAVDQNGKRIFFVEDGGKIQAGEALTRGGKQLYQKYKLNSDGTPDLTSTVQDETIEPPMVIVKSGTTADTSRCVSLQPGWEEGVAENGDIEYHYYEDKVGNPAKSDDPNAGQVKEKTTTERPEKPIQGCPGPEGLAKDSQAATMCDPCKERQRSIIEYALGHLSTMRPTCTNCSFKRDAEFQDDEGNWTLCRPCWAKTASAASKALASKPRPPPRHHRSPRSSTRRASRVSTTKASARAPTTSRAASPKRATSRTPHAGQPVSRHVPPARVNLRKSTTTTQSGSPQPTSGELTDVKGVKPPTKIDDPIVLAEIKEGAYVWAFGSVFGANFGDRGTIVSINRELNKVKVLWSKICKCSHGNDIRNNQTQSIRYASKVCGLGVKNICKGTGYVDNKNPEWSSDKIYSYKNNRRRRLADRLLYYEDFYSSGAEGHPRYFN